MNYWQCVLTGGHKYSDLDRDKLFVNPIATSAEANCTRCGKELILQKSVRVFEKVKF